MRDSVQTYTFAPEIETAVVSIMWHDPERVAHFRRQCDPAVQLLQSHLPIILNAIEIAYAELGDVDFPVIAQIVRELGKFDEVGGLAGLNAVYSATEKTIYSDRIFDDYIALLKDYASARQQEPLARPVTRFTGGKASLYLNKTKRRSTDPDYLGDARVRGASYRLRGWLCEDAESVNITLQPL